MYVQKRILANITWAFINRKQILKFILCFVCSKWTTSFEKQARELSKPLVVWTSDEHLLIFIHSCKHSGISLSWMVFQTQRHAYECARKANKKMHQYLWSNFVAFIWWILANTLFHYSLKFFTLPANFYSGEKHTLNCQATSVLIFH